MSGIGAPRSFRHGEEHRVAEEVYPGQGKPYAGGSDPSGHEDTASQRGILPGSSTTQASHNVPYNNRHNGNLKLHVLVIMSLL